MTARNGSRNGKTQANGRAQFAHGPAPKQAKPASLKSLRQKIQLEEAQIRLGRLQQARKLQEHWSGWDWINDYSGILNSLTQQQSSQFVHPYANIGDRQHGANWPFFRDDQQLGHIRALSRILVTMSPLASGTLEGWLSYVIGEGFAYRAASKRKDREAERRLKPLIAAVQDTIDDFVNGTGDGNDPDDSDDAEPHTWGWKEQECFRRTRRDGEAFIRLFEEENGRIRARFVEPEQVRPPMDWSPTDDEEDWSFGILTGKDVVRPKMYNCVYFNVLGQAEDEQVDARDMVHIKINVDENIKRGLPDFSFETHDGFRGASKLIRNLAEGSAVQASHAVVREHATATKQDITSFADAEKDYTVPNPLTGVDERVKHFRAGTVVDVPQGMKLGGAPYSQGVAGHVQVTQQVLRSLAVKWNAPEWITSGDASNNNYASSITAESPFVKRTKKEQAFYKGPFKRVIWRVVRARCERGLYAVDPKTGQQRKWSWDEVRRLIDLQVEPPTVETRNRLEEAQENQVYAGMRLRSPQTISARLGDDYEQEQSNIQTHEEEYGPMFGGAGGGMDDGGLGAMLGGAPEPPKPPKPPSPDAKLKAPGMEAVLEDAREDLLASIEAAAAQTDLSPSDAQKESGNYRKGKTRLHGLEIAIENPRGSVRSGTSKDGKSWSVTMANHYGYIKRTESEADGDHMDVFLGDNPDSGIVYVVDQTKPNGKFDEHKCMLGFLSKAEALDAYHANYSPGWKGYGDCVAMSLADFREWLHGDTSKPVALAESEKLHHCVKGVTAKGNADEPWAVCRAALGECDASKCDCAACRKLRECDQGVNKGKPGPCPDGGDSHDASNGAGWDSSLDKPTRDLFGTGQMVQRLRPDVEKALRAVMGQEYHALKDVAERDLLPADVIKKAAGLVASGQIPTAKGAILHVMPNAADIYKHRLAQRGKATESVDPKSRTRRVQFEKDARGRIIAFTEEIGEAEGTCKAGERSDLTGCTPATGDAASGKDPAAADDNAKGIIARVGGAVSALIDKVPVVGKIKQGLTAAVGKAKQKLASRYGDKMATIILASGTVADLGITGATTALLGVPITFPGASLVMSLPALVAAELHLQAKKLLGGATEAEEVLDDGEVESAVAEFKAEITAEFERLLKDYGLEVAQGLKGLARAD